MYQDLGYETYEECCADYPEYCDTKEKKCSIMKDYKHFNINTCMPKGWPQKNDDCWLDSSLYAMFAPTDISNFFSNILDKLHESSNKDENNIALSINNYLHGLNDPKWSETDECKQKIKNDIGAALISWDKKHKKIFNISNENAMLYDSLFLKDGTGDIGRGPQDILFKFFSIISKDYVNIHTLNGEQNKMRTMYKTKEIVTNKLKHKTLYNKKLVIISINNNNKDKDNTTLDDIKNINNYKLQSVVYGSGAHIITVSLCRNKYIMYNNMELPIKNILNNKNIFNLAEQLILVYSSNKLINIDNLDKLKKIKQKVQSIPSPRTAATRTAATRTAATRTSGPRTVSKRTSGRNASTRKIAPQTPSTSSGASRTGATRTTSTRKVESKTYSRRTLSKGIKQTPKGTKI